MYLTFRSNGVFGTMPDEDPEDQVLVGMKEFILRRPTEERGWQLLDGDTRLDVYNDLFSGEPIVWGRHWSYKSNFTTHTNDAGITLRHLVVYPLAVFEEHMHVSIPMSGNLYMVYRPADSFLWLKIDTNIRVLHDENAKSCGLLLPVTFSANDVIWGDSNGLVAVRRFSMQHTRKDSGIMDAVIEQWRRYELAENVQQALDQWMTESLDLLHYYESSPSQVGCAGATSDSSKS